MTIGIIQLAAALMVGEASAVERTIELADAPTPANEKEQIEAATADWGRAIVARDRVALESIMTADFTLTGGDLTESVPLDLWLGNLLKMHFTKYEARVVGVRMYGKIAVADVHGKWDVTVNGRRRSEAFRLADFWVFRDGRWQVFRRYRIR